MSVTMRALRRRILTPNSKAAKADVRKFHVKNQSSRQLLETVGEKFLTGFSYAAEASAPAEAEVRLETIEHRFRGFAYEGAAMGFTIMDALRVGGPSGIDRFLTGRGDDHVYMVHIGIGWAFARLPRFLWPKVAPKDQLLRWLVLDGYGFHQAYFRTDKYVHGQYQDSAFPWPGDGPRHYANRAIDQGIGRALWFVNGTDPTRVASMIEGFPTHRHSDLWSGAGLAATYAGGADEAELQELRKRAGEHRALVAQASAFAAKTRLRANLVTPHTRLATEVFCGMSPEQAAAVTDETRPSRIDETGSAPTYEVWRQRIANQFVALGRC